MATVRRLFVQRPNLAAEAAKSSISTAGPWDGLAIGDVLPLDREEQHYAKDVLRLKEGDEVTITDGAGFVAQAALRVVGPKKLACALLSTFERAPSLLHTPKLIVACPMPKGERADWMAEKLAELGVYAWVWVVCARSVVLPKGANKHERLLRLMRAAARQARHGRVPILMGPMPLQEHLAAVQAGPPSSRFVADAAGITVRSALSSAHSAHRQLLVGPEGGLTDDELQAAHGAGYGRLTLGPHILRVETAAIACAVLMGQVDG